MKRREAIRRIGIGAAFPLLSSIAARLPSTWEAGRLSARPSSDAKTPRRGTHALGLGRDRDGWLVVPDNAPATNASLVLALHGAGGSGRNVASGIMGRTCAELGVVMVAPDSRDMSWDVVRGDFGPDVAFIDRALAQVFKQLSVDARRVGIIGFSDGASYALSLGLINGDLFPRIAAFSPGFLTRGARHERPQIFLSHGTRDPILPIEQCSRPIAADLKRQGYTVTLKEFDGGHMVPREIAAQALKWISDGTALGEKTPSRG